MLHGETVVFKSLKEDLTIKLARSDFLAKVS